MKYNIDFFMITFAHSFWSKPLLEKKFAPYNIALAIILVNYAYSVTCCHKYGYKIKLYTDARGAELLKGIPYDDVIIIDMPEHLSIHFAAAIKFYALQKMTLDEVLIDGDLFIENQIGFDYIDLLEGDLVYSYFENTKTIHNDCPDKFKPLLSLLSKQDLLYTLPDISHVQWPNTSLMKFNNETLKKEYIDQYFYHLNKLKDIDFGEDWPDIIIEQYFLYMLAIQHHYTIIPLLKMSNQEKIDKLGFNHLGSNKQNAHNKVCDNLAKENIQLYNYISERFVELKSNEEEE